METIVNVTLPIFSIMLAGYLSGYWKILGEDSTNALNRFVFLIALPPAMFVFTARADIDDILNWQFMAAFILAMLIMVAFSTLIARFIFGHNRELAAFHGFISIFSNHGYVGIPVFLAAFGADGILPPIITGLIGGIPAMIFIMSALEIMRSGSRSELFRSIWQMFWRNPLFVATILGIVFSIYSIPLPTAVANLLDMMAATVGPTALFALGLSLVGRSIGGELRDVIWLSFLKLVVHPLITFLVVTQLFHISPFWAASAVILAAMPVGPTSFVVAQQYGLAVRVSSATVALTTIGSMFTLTALMIYYGIS